MSRWLPDALRIELSSDEVVWERRVAGLGSSGIRWQLRDRRVFETEGAARGEWAGSLQVIGRCLAELAGQRVVATVVLANTLVHYVMVPRSKLVSPEQEASVVLHYFKEVYGSASDRWELRASDAPETGLQVACGVDRTLLDQLRALFDEKSARLRSIQPRLMDVCNKHRVTLGSGPSWLIVLEPEGLCLGLIAEGGLIRLRGFRMSGDKWAMLPALLEREACLADLDSPPTNAFLWSRDARAGSNVNWGKLMLHVINDPDPGSAVERSNALAVAGG